MVYCFVRSGANHFFPFLAFSAENQPPHTLALTHTERSLIIIIYQVFGYLSLPLPHARLQSLTLLKAELFGC